ncbi:MAG: hypothetical protein ACO27F_04475 [Beijerinckiaceae bacterium]|jgi:hypothetical protein
MLAHRRSFLAARVIEQAMVFSLGFLCAGLLALLLLPAVWRRAVRLSRRRLETLTPLSMDEILAERDLLRAQFAVERRRLEQAKEAVEATRARDMAELGRRAVARAAAEARLEEAQAELAQARRRIEALERRLTHARTRGKKLAQERDAQEAADAALREAIATVGEDVTRLSARLALSRELAAREDARPPEDEREEDARAGAREEGAREDAAAWSAPPAPEAPVSLPPAALPAAAGASQPPARMAAGE